MTFDAKSTLRFTDLKVGQMFILEHNQGLIFRKTFPFFQSIYNRNAVYWKGSAPAIPIPYFLDYDIKVYPEKTES